MNADILTSTAMRAAESLTPPEFAVPAGACDAHVHVFTPGAQYPRVARPHYTLPDGPVEKLLAMADRLSLQNLVIVQPSFYGTDNRCMLDALRAIGSRARGVAMVGDDCTVETLRELHGQGVRALRLDLFSRAQLPTHELIRYIERAWAMVRQVNWHLQFYTPGWVVRDLLPFLADFDATYVIDHMGYMLESDGLTRGDFDRLLKVIESGTGWIKLSGPYRIAKDGNFDRLIPLAQAIIAAAPERVVWGSDWPHIPDGAKDTGQILNLLSRWAPDHRTREAILSRNPARLFDFGVPSKH